MKKLAETLLFAALAALFLTAAFGAGYYTRALTAEDKELAVPVPGLTTAAQYSGSPFPFPIRVSAGFLVMGLSGKIRTHTRPPRLT